MTCFNKKEYKQLKACAKQAGDVFLASRELEFSEASSGVTVAFRPAIENSNCRMLEVAVSYCSNEDTYKRKHGKYQALRKLAYGVVVQIPLAQELRDVGAEDLGFLLLDMFSV